MMNSMIFRFFPFAALLLALSGCSGYNKLLKSGDRDLIYRKGMEFYEAGKYQKALTLFQEIAPYYSGTYREDSLTYYTGSAFYKSGDFEASGMVLDDFRRRFGRSPFIEDAEYMYAMGFYFSSPDSKRDQTSTHQALIAINEYLDRYPNSPKRDEANERIKILQRKLYDKAYYNAKSYFTTGHYKSAVVALKNALDLYPETPHREEILYMTVKSGYLLAKNSIPGLQRDRYLDMMDYYYNFASEFPESRHIRELERMQAEAKDFLARTEPEP